MADVFISYAREDYAFVQRLHAALAAREREAWVDWQGIAPTAEWMAEIMRAIDGADAAVFVLSPSWLASRVCAEELAHAAGRRKRLIPIVCAPLDEGAPVPDALARLNWVLMREGDDFDAAVERLLDALATDFAHVREHTGLVLRSAEWEARGRDRGGLLAGSQLTDAERSLASAAALGDPTPTPLQAHYIAASREAATRRQRMTLAAVATALVVAIGLALWAAVERRNAIEQRDEAVRQRQAAQARQLASRAEYLQNADPALGPFSVLLAAESLRLLPNVEADQVLRRALATNAPFLNAKSHGGIDSPLAVADNGHTLAIGDHRGMVRVFDTSLRVEMQLFPLRGQRIEHLAVSRGGTLLVAGDRRDVRIVDARELNAREAHERRHECGRDLHAIALSPWDSHLAIACEGEVVLYDTSDWRALSLPVRNPVAMAFPQHRVTEQVALLDAEGTVQVFDLQGRAIARIETQVGNSSRWMRCCHGWLAYSGRGKWLAAGNLDRNEVHVIGTEHWTQQATLALDDSLQALAFADEPEDFAATGSADGRVRVWDVESGKSIYTAQHGGSVTNLRFVANSAWLASASADRTARLWDKAGNERARASHEGPVMWAGHVQDRLISVDMVGALRWWGSRPRIADAPPLAVHCRTPDGRITGRISDGRSGGGMRLVSGDGKTVWAKEPQRDSRTKLAALTPDCSRAALADDTAIELFAPSSSERLARLGLQLGGSDDSLAFGSSGRFLVASRRSGGTQVWRSADGTPLALPAGCDASEVGLDGEERHIAMRCGDELVLLETASGRTVERRALAPGGNHRFTRFGLLIASPGRLELLPLAAGVPAASVGLPPGTAPTMLVDAGSNSVVVGSGSSMSVWSLPSLRRLNPASAPPSKPVSSTLALSPDGRLLASTDDTKVRVWSLDPWQLRFEADVPGRASAIGFDPLGRWFAAGLTRWRAPGDADHTVRIWQVADGREIARLSDTSGGAFDASGGFVSGDKRHAIEPAQLIDAACKLVERNLSLVEWRREIHSKEAHRTCPGLAPPADDGRDWER